MSVGKTIGAVIAGIIGVLLIMGAIGCIFVTGKFISGIVIGILGVVSIVICVNLAKANKQT